jgi:hypothetical protein
LKVGYKKTINNDANTIILLIRPNFLNKTINKAKATKTELENKYAAFHGKLVWKSTLDAITKVKNKAQHINA